MLSHTDWGDHKSFYFSNQSNVFQCQLDNLLLKNSHVNFSRNIPFKKFITSWNLSACSICERTAFFEVSWSHEQVHEQWAWASESVFHILYLHLPPKDELIKDEICLLKVEDNVQLTHRSEVFVQYFDIPIKSNWMNNTSLRSTDGACPLGNAQWPPRKHNQWKENLWITSSTLSSLSVRSTAKQKKRLA